MTNPDTELIENIFFSMDDDNPETTSPNSTLTIEDRLNGVNFLKPDDSEDNNNSLFPKLDEFEWAQSGQCDFTDMLNNATATDPFNSIMGRSNNNKEFTSTTATSPSSINTLLDKHTHNYIPNIPQFAFSNNDNNQKENVINPPFIFPDEENKRNEEDTDNVVKQKVLLRNKKNAEMAKASRQKKKDYLQNLENKVHGLTEDNDKLKQEKEELVSLMKNKDEEINYLKNILANHTAISQMLGTISQVPVVKKIRLSPECSPPPDDYWSESSSIPNFDQCPHVTTTAGICLHFKPSNHISLEYCATCSQSSQMAILQQKEQEQFYPPDEVSKA